MQFAAAGHPVNLGDRIVLLQNFQNRRKRFGRCFNLKIAGNRPADFLRIDHRCVFLNHAFLFKRLHPHLGRHAGNAHLLAQFGIGNPCVGNQQPHNLAVQFVQPIQKHTAAPFGKSVCPQCTASAAAWQDLFGAGDRKRVLLGGNVLTIRNKLPILDFEA